MPPPAGPLWPKLRAYQIWGARADVGKTVFSTILCLSAGHRRPHEHAIFLQPVVTGPKEAAGHRHADAMFRKKIGPKPPKDRFTARCLVHYEEPGSPHIAAAQSDQEIISDSKLAYSVYNFVSQCATDAPPLGSWLFCETVGGVLTPGPSGTLQADLYRPLRVPAILIGDPGPDGISSTINAFESLRLRGYDVECVLMFQNDALKNDEYLTPYFQKFGIPCIATRPPPERSEEAHKDKSQSYHYFDSIARSNVIKALMKDMQKRHAQRIKSVENMPDEAHKTMWFPFMHQKLLTPEDITAVDSAFGDHLQTGVVTPPSITRIDPRTLRKNTRHQMQVVSDSHLRPSFDGSASWWTKGIGHANPQLTLAAAYAAGRYGHIPSEAIHEPGLQLAKTLLKKLDNPRLSRVFYSDNGSAGTEVAVKMALRAAKLHYGWESEEDVCVLGLKDTPHSESGLMDQRLLDFPTVKMSNGDWVVDVPEKLSADSKAYTATFKGLDEIFDLQARDGSELAKSYALYIIRTIEGFKNAGDKLGALILEPVVLGVDGMKLVDPLFQRVLVDTIRSNPRLFSESIPANEKSNDWTSLPVVFDEGLTGLYRLGQYSFAKTLGIQPDISVHAQLLTGGVVPLSATIASESIFRAFESADESDALLDGHSFTAHPIGCQVALESMKAIDQKEADGAWSGFQSKWTVGDEEEVSVWSVWGQDFLQKLSKKTGKVESTWALGSALAIRFEEGVDAIALQVELKDEKTDKANSNVHCQVSDNVLYLMASQTSGLDTIEELEKRILEANAFRGLSGRLLDEEGL
ncbi:hypothetical protein VMCG_02515 [Cytospora schulzeri]|uniref:Dethiobiotin synthase n=1 Tax=Cytospora schulzeri TaxID=448051 RepID=A0A423X142_9PEZI|nr:hypothetical protein VMCG_02515 [Valsa malicola]